MISVHSPKRVHKLPRHDEGLEGVLRNRAILDWYWAHQKTIFVLLNAAKLQVQVLNWVLDRWLHLYRQCYLAKDFFGRFLCYLLLGLLSSCKCGCWIDTSLVITTYTYLIDIHSQH
jgi:hypothetical protein